MDRITYDLVVKDKVVRLTLADQEKAAAILTAPPHFTPALERAFAAHRKLIRQS